jgi:hypothetical protein
MSTSVHASAVLFLVACTRDMLAPDSDCKSQRERVVSGGKPRARTSHGAAALAEAHWCPQLTCVHPMRLVCSAL